MTEVTFLKILWFVAGFLASGAMFSAINQNEVTRSERWALAMIPMIICIVLYVFARAITLSPVVAQ